MIPTKSNLYKSGCSPVSSECVIWQGPCLDCINLQTGDSISDATYKLATEVCQLMDQLDLTNLDLSCLMEACSGCPEPEKTLSAILTLLINKICALEDLIGTGEEPATPEQVVINIAACFQTTDINGDLITTLPIEDYVKAIGNKLCALATTVSLNTTSITNHEARITSLENQDTTVVLPSISPSCTFGMDTSPKQMDVLLDALEEQFCQLRSATGTSSELLQAASKQCNDLSNSPALGTTGNMSGISGWKSTVSTVADSLNNLWLTLCDLRTAMAAVKDCCAITCKDVIVDFLPVVSTDGNTLRLNFNGYSDIPSGFAECNTSGSQLTITDQSGETYSVYINVIDIIASGTYYSIDLTATSLAAVGDLNISLASCLTDGTLNCSKTIIKKVTIPDNCLAPTNVSASIV